MRFLNTNQKKTPLVPHSYKAAAGLPEDESSFKLQNEIFQSQF